MIYYFYQQIIREKIYLSMYYGFKYDTETAHCNNRTIIPSPPRLLIPHDHTFANQLNIIRYSGGNITVSRYTKSQFERSLT